MKAHRLILFAALAGAAIVFTPISASAQEKKDGEKPIAHGRLKGVGVAKPIYESDLHKDVAADAAKVDKLVDYTKETKLNPDKDSVEKMFEGSISVARHLAEVGKVSESISHCMAAMQNDIAAKRDSGTATPEEKAQLDKCDEHCKKVNATLDKIHQNSSRLGTATRQQYILDGWDKHQKAMAELQGLMKDCPAMFSETMKHTGMPMEKPAAKPDKK